MMESLRNFLTGPRLIIVVLVCAVPFVFLGTSSLTSVFGGSFGTINGEDVTETDLQLASNTAVQRFKSIYGEEFDFDMLDDDLRIESIKQELIVQKVLQSGARSLGLINNNTTDEAKKSIIRNPQFQINGIFDENVYEAQVNSNGYTKEGYIELMTNLLASELYRSSLTGLNFATDYEIFELTKLLEKSSDIEFTKLSYSGLKNEIVNTSDELIEFYDNNQILFFSNEERSFNYIVLSQDSYKNDVVVPESYIADVYKEYLDNFSNSAQVRFSHIMVEKNNYETRDLAFDVITKAEDLINSGVDFSEVASDLSEDIITKDIGGDLEYFDSEIFPEEFGLAIASLGMNETSGVIELNETFHILKVTELNVQEPLAESQIKDELMNELVETESYALMNDDFDIVDEMIAEGSSIEQIAEYISKNLKTSELYTQENYSFDFNSPEIRNYLFSPDSKLDAPYAIELDDMVIVMSLNNIIVPALMNYEEVADNVGELLAESKAAEKLNLLEEEFNSIEDSQDKQSFIEAYNFVTTDTFVDVKRYSSLLPQEVLSDIFNAKAGELLKINAQNGDKYFVDIVAFKQPNESEINEIIEEYKSFAEERSASKMSEVINEDVFESARVNLNNLIF
ncbi:SurA N-terminal domain-containing protein [Gammaproteobacteria bacterium]|nr:SurA N-terminal domain-containing protein [Gammaproteobacteria bacterium]